MVIFTSMDVLNRELRKVSKEERRESHGEGKVFAFTMGGEKIHGGGLLMTGQERRGAKLSRFIIRVQKEEARGKGSKSRES